jgi:hypothetical protein
MLLFQIVAPHFVAGFETDETHVVRTAPIIKYMLGWRREQVWTYVVDKGWRMHAPS